MEIENTVAEGEVHQKIIEDQERKMKTGTKEMNQTEAEQQQVISTEEDLDQKVTEDLLHKEDSLSQEEIIMIRRRGFICVKSTILVIRIMKMILKTEQFMLQNVQTAH